MRISDSMLSQLDLIDDFVASLLLKILKMNVDKSSLFNIKLALHEAIINAVKHGNQSRPDLSVQVDITREENQLTIQVTDHGEGFDYQNLPDPITTENLEKLNGRGLFLIQNAMDRVEFSGQGRTIKMFKFL